MAFTTNLSQVSIGAGPTPVQAVGSIEITNNRAALEITELGESSRKFTHGLQDATASLTLYYDQLSTGHTTIEALITNPASTLFTISLTTGQQYIFNAYVTSFAITAQAGELVQANVSLQVTGSVTIV